MVLVCNDPAAVDELYAHLAWQMPAVAGGQRLIRWSSCGKILDTRQVCARSPGWGRAAESCRSHEHSP
jgi:hypothetical protein